MMPMNMGKGDQARSAACLSISCQCALPDVQSFPLWHLDKRRSGGGGVLFFLGGEGHDCPFRQGRPFTFPYRAGGITVHSGWGVIYLGGGGAWL